MQVLLSFGSSKGVCLVQVSQNLDGILLGTQVGKDPVELFLDVQRLHLNLITVEGHQIGLHSEGTGLVQSSATARGTQFAHIGDIHLAQCIKVQII